MLPGFKRRKREEEKEKKRKWLGKLTITWTKQPCSIRTELPGGTNHWSKERDRGSQLRSKRSKWVEEFLISLGDPRRWEVREARPPVQQARLAIWKARQDFQHCQRYRVHPKIYWKAFNGSIRKRRGGGGRLNKEEKFKRKQKILFSIQNFQPSKRCFLRHFSYIRNEPHSKL